MPYDLRVDIFAEVVGYGIIAGGREIIGLGSVEVEVRHAEHWRGHRRRRGILLDGYLTAVYREKGLVGEV